MSRMAGRFGKETSMKRFYAILLAFALLCSVCISSAAGGSEQDPVVTKSYLDEVFVPKLLKTAQETIDKRFNTLLDTITRRISDSSSPSGILFLLMKAGGYKLSYGSRSGRYTVPQGMYVGGGLGTMFTPQGSGFSAYITDNGAMADITDGTECISGQALTANHTYIIASVGGAAVLAKSQSDLTVDGPYFTLGLGSIGAASAPAVQTPVSTSPEDIRYKAYADKLFTLGLFSGTDTGYELGRSATRAESIVMLLRLLGELPAAQEYTAKSPFTDVPDWASRYVSYAYAMKYTAGTSAKTFGTQQSVTAAQYITFVLRALGYSDVDGDFYWETAGDFAAELGLITPIENAAMRARFWRDEMVLVSFRALNMKLKGSEQTLGEKLISLDIIDAVTFADVQ